MKKRRRSEPHTFEGYIAASKERLEAEASQLSGGPADGPERERLREKIRQLETAAAMNTLLSADR